VISRQVTRSDRREGVDATIEVVLDGLLLLKWMASMAAASMSFMVLHAVAI
jgi:hypothetical protein